MLKLQNVDVGYSAKNKNVLIENINFELKQGETTALIGINGAGKSTLLRTIGGMIPILKGKLLLDETPISKFASAEISKKIAFVSTDFIKVKHLTAYELTALGRFPYTGRFGILGDNDKKIVEKSLQTVGISHLSNKYIDQMSDGERQRSMIARALSQDTEILLLDEPASFLDLENKYLVYDILKQTATSENKAILFSTHDLNIALKTADNLIVIKNKRIISGIPEDLILNGVFDSIFDREKIIFNIETVDFQFKSNLNRKITFNCTNPILNALILNGLNRKGFSPVSYKTNFEILIFENLHKTNYQLIIDGESENFATIGGLIKALPKNFPTRSESI